MNRTNLRLGLVVLLALLCGWAVARAGAAGTSASPAVKPVAAVNDDAGDEQATTTYDGPMVRKRVAIALHVADGADRKLIGRQLQTAAEVEKVGPLSDATFAVFSATMLNYLVPEMTVVLPEGGTAEDAEVLMRDHEFNGVNFYLIENVLVHDLTFAVIPSGVTPEAASAQQDAEGVLSDSLNHYATTVQRSGLTVRYFGAIISDGQVRAVREAMARAAHVTPDRVAVEPSSPGPGVDLSNGAPDLSDDMAGMHHGG
ncbi:MAG TPA: hypothetical protein VH502_09995 [Actinoplanes sp.]